MRNEPNRKNRINKVEEGSFVDRKIVTFSYLPVSKVELFQETKYWKIAEILTKAFWKQRRGSTDNKKQQIIEPNEKRQARNEGWIPQ